MSPSLLSPPPSKTTSFADAARLQATAVHEDLARSADPIGTRLAATKKTSAAKKKAAAKKKKVPVCTAKDLKTKKSKRRKCTLVKKKPIATTVAGKPAPGKPGSTAPGTTAPGAAAPTPASSPTGPVAAPPVTAPTPDAWTPLPTATDDREDGLPVYKGPFGVEQATRLLFRGAFGPLPGQAEEFASLGVKGAVARLMNPPSGLGASATLAGPAPTGDWLVAGQFAPADRWNHGTLQFLDRIVRSTDQLGERMTMILHDWLAINAADIGARPMMASINTMRGGWRGSFRQLMLDMTIDPAMLAWLSGLGSDKRAPNENYAREILELFCLGADRGAYTEADIREMARGFTGWTADWSAEKGLYNHRFDKYRWDATEKVYFRGTTYERRGTFDWKDTVHAVIDHPMHPSFVALKLWGAFIPTPPTPETLAQLEALYRSSGDRLEPLVEAILRHPDLYNGPSVTKSPVTYVAGLLRSRGRGLQEDAWAWILDNAGQAPWYPPNVSGWNERAWLNTTTYGARWYAASAHVNEKLVEPADYGGSTETPEQAVDAALAFWGNPAISAAHRGVLLAHARESMTLFYWNQAALQRAMRQNTLRMLVVAAPDHQVS